MLLELGVTSMSFSQIGNKLWVFLRYLKKYITKKTEQTVQTVDSLKTLIHN